MTRQHKMWPLTRVQITPPPLRRELQKDNTNWHSLEYRLHPPTPEEGYSNDKTTQAVALVWVQISPQRATRMTRQQTKALTRVQVARHRHRAESVVVNVLVTKPA